MIYEFSDECPFPEEGACGNCPHLDFCTIGYGECDEDEDLEEGEINLFSAMPWFNQNIGSIMEHQLTKYREPNQCRQCGKFDEKLREKETPERFCSEKCRNDWKHLLDVRIAQGKHDLRTRGFD